MSFFDYDQILWKRDLNLVSVLFEFFFQIPNTLLQKLCEKGLGAMALTQERIVSELNEKHAKELAELTKEKEESLAEETQVSVWNETHRVLLYKYYYHNA